MQRTKPERSVSQNKSQTKWNSSRRNCEVVQIPGRFGIRIEDTVIVGKSTGVALTKSNKEIIKIEGV